MEKHGQHGGIYRIGGDTMAEVNAAGSTQSQNAVTNATKNILGKDDFLKLLMTQLKYQDPMEPADNKEFIAQMAQFTTLEQMGNISAGFADLNSLQIGLLQESAASRAINLIGRYVEAVDPETKAVISGLVTGMKVVDGIPKIIIGANEVDAGTITKVTAG
ncbi:flagellar hook capping protein [bacterium]|nr:MAG: flagellar hook capping protein [bacterium]